MMITVMMIFAGLSASAAEKMNYSCTVYKSDKEIAEINSKDLVESADGHQFLFKKTVENLDIQVYRDSAQALQYTGITISDKKSSVLVSASTEYLQYQNANGNYSISCVEDLFAQ